MNGSDRGYDGKPNWMLFTCITFILLLKIHIHVNIIIIIHKDY